ncbi:hypothetical protein FIU95_06440 [Microbulbifer sp. THAF38]|nr:hypothetical protein FIU95_06440 [Microbulbifer sp. THAF38]
MTTTGSLEPSLILATGALAPMQMKRKQKHHDK